MQLWGTISSGGAKGKFERGSTMVKEIRMEEEALAARLGTGVMTLNSCQTNSRQRNYVLRRLGETAGHLNMCLNNT